MNASWSRLARYRPHAGIGWCTFEGTALAVNDPSVLPRWTDLCHPREGAPTAEQRARLVLAVGSVGWAAVHLLAPWVRMVARRVRA